mmetsp:Transcript_32773/g.64943  ORF Transcript_32773/g.64943 Transcript_32773/m.64943 type:complete len:87 (+) Transcript_32773:290-550(+)
MPTCIRRRNKIGCVVALFNISAHRENFAGEEGFIPSYDITDIYGYSLMCVYFYAEALEKMHGPQNVRHLNLENYETLSDCRGQDMR